MQQGMGPDCIGKNSRVTSVGRDLAAVLAITVGVAAVAIGLELNEKIFEVTRHFESMQLDEAPIVLFAFASSLTWFAWRRYRDARIELAARRAAEARLESVLDAHRRLAQQYVRVQEQERKSLARELHDELGQYLNAIKTDAVSIHEKSSTESPQFSRASLAIVQHADHVHGVVRDLIRKLRPVALDDLGLRAALEHFVDQWRARFPKIVLNVVFEGDLDELDEQTSLTIFRLAQESMTNIAKHANASQVTLQVTRTASEVMFAVTDNGAGAGSDTNTRGPGLGLIGMRERVEMLGGALQVTTAPAQGFRIHAHVPVTKKEREVES